MTYTDAELIAFLKTHKTVSVRELQYGFGGTSASHAARLRELVKAGVLVRNGTDYSLANAA